MTIGAISSEAGVVSKSGGSGTAASQQNEVSDFNIFDPKHRNKLQGTGGFIATNNIGGYLNGSVPVA